MTKAKKPKKPVPEVWKVGDRVASTYVSKEPALWPRTHGVVVYYRKTDHDPKEPRVRWADGWGTSVSAKHLRPLTRAEMKKWPRRPTLYDCDRST